MQAGRAPRPVPGSRGPGERGACPSLHPALHTQEAVTLYLSPLHCCDVSPSPQPNHPSMSVLCVPEAGEGTSQCQVNIKRQVTSADRESITTVTWSWNVLGARRWGLKAVTRSGILHCGHSQSESPLAADFSGEPAARALRLRNSERNILTQ